jgi:hypothetical protein
VRASLLALLLVLPAPPQGGGQELQALGHEFWAWRALHQPITSDDVPRISRPHGWRPDVSRDAIAAITKDLASFESRWKALAPAASAPVPEQVDYRLLGSALSRVRWELEGVRSYRRDPGFYVQQTLGALVDLILPSTPWTEARGHDVVVRLQAFPKVLADGEQNLDEIVQPFSELAIADLQGIGPSLRASVEALRPLVAPGDREPLKAALEAAVPALESYRTFLEAHPGKAGVAVGSNAYESFLKKVALIPYTPDEILAMGRQEWARAVAAEAYEARRNEGTPELPIFASQEEQIRAAARDEEKIRRFLGEKGILTVPAWMRHYGYRPIPAALEPLAGFGEGTDFTPAPGPEGEATRYIPRPAPSLGYFALSMAKDPRADMVHEGIPGHGFQIALSRHHEDELRRQWVDSSINEGLGFYCEEMMLAMGLFDDSPRSREMIWNYARLRALRVEVDVQLALGRLSIADAASYLEAAVPMDAATARAEAASFAANPGFAIDYQIGKLQITKFLAEARKQQGAKFDLKAFHDSLFKNGNVPVSLQRWELLGLRDEVERLDAP